MYCEGSGQLAAYMAGVVTWIISLPPLRVDKGFCSAWQRAIRWLQSINQKQTKSSLDWWLPLRFCYRRLRWGIAGALAIVSSNR
uniref:Uncharacterized protein n=1 Tax=Physcomitrium patens TaxID=3218 RepID=A0A2K1II88_PHYPA|nr:hypothetical protein PHYPA_027683 [Physcomitrium patens]